MTCQSTPYVFSHHNTSFIITSDLLQTLPEFHLTDLHVYASETTAKK